MSSEERYIFYHGLMLPKETHCSESLKFAQEFTFQDNDVVAVTYPKAERSKVWATRPSPLLNLLEDPGLSTVMSTDKYIQHGGILLPSECHSAESLEFAHNLSVEDTNVFVVTFPKSGTIWMQEILPLVLNGGDLTPIQTIPNWDRVPWLEEKRLAFVVDQLASPRAMVTHFPHHLMPPSFHTSKAKVIYVMRNPMDVMVSSYYFHQMAGFLEDPGTFDEFMEKFLEGRVLFGKWTDHVKSWRHKELGDRIIYITYEEMVQDLPAALRRISDFLGRNLSEETIQKIAEHCSFKTMKANNMSNFSLVPKVYMDADKSPFFRKGVAGDWRNHFTSEQLAQFMSVISKELEGENFSLPYLD